MIADLLVRFFLWLARRNGPPKVYTGRNTASPYLTRYFLTKRSAETEGLDSVPEGEPPKWGLYLHCFHRGDDDPQLHNHPWKWAVSLVLKGGYSEERRTKYYTPEGWGPITLAGEVERRAVRPWSLNFLRGEDFHRVDLLDGDAWTLFLVGPIVQSWGFLDRSTWRFTPWKKFLGIEP